MKTISTLLNVLFLFVVAISSSQRLDAPELGFDYACVSEGYNSFQATISFDEKPFKADNVFYVELSDQFGLFNDPTVLEVVKDQNFSFEFQSTFAFPNSVAGEGYKIRVRSTSPKMVSEGSAVFDAYLINNQELILNNYKDVNLCGSGTTTIALNVDIAQEYVWFKDGELFKLTQENTLAISEPGEYYVEPYYGNCTGSNYSNLVVAKTAEEFTVAITSEKDAQDCSATKVTLRASVDNENYNYSWFKNDTKIEGLTGYFPSIVLDYNNHNIGAYHVVVTKQGGCEAVSNSYSFNQNKGAVVEVTSPLNAVIIGDHLATLSIKTDSNAGEITWYKDGQLLKDGYNSNTLEVADQGDYYAMVSDVNQCGGATKSQTFKIYEPISYNIQIEASKDYEPCLTTEARLSLKSVKGLLSNGDVITVAKEFYPNFQFKWTKDESLVSNGAELNIDYTDNGNYTLALDYKGKVYNSNTLEMIMGLPSMVLSVEKEFSCQSSKGILSVDTDLKGAVYNWYKNGKLIASNDINSLSATKDGEYKVEVSYAGCSLTTASVSLKRDTTDLIAIYPGESATIGPEGIIQANATGGNSYTWFSDQGEVLSDVSTLNITQTGVYTLIAITGSCTVEKTITVDANMVENIPNVVSPNNDTVNDKWTLPQKFINDPETEVVICDAYGATVLKTTSYDNSWPSSTSQFTSQTPVYYYFINKNGKNLKKGSITLVN